MVLASGCPPTRECAQKPGHPECTGDAGGRRRPGHQLPALRARPPHVTTSLGQLILVYRHSKWLIWPRRGVRGVKGVVSNPHPWQPLGIMGAQPLSGLNSRSPQHLAPAHLPSPDTSDELTSVLKFYHLCNSSVVNGASSARVRGGEKAPNQPLFHRQEEGLSCQFVPDPPSDPLVSAPSAEDPQPFVPRDRSFCHRQRFWNKNLSTVGTCHRGEMHTVSGTRQPALLGRDPHHGGCSATEGKQGTELPLHQLSQGAARVLALRAACPLWTAQHPSQHSTPRCS